jgi:hypothetical protein
LKKLAIIDANLAFTAGMFAATSVIHTKAHLANKTGVRPHGDAIRGNLDGDLAELQADAIRFGAEYAMRMGHEVSGGDVVSFRLDEAGGPCIVVMSQEEAAAEAAKARAEAAGAEKVSEAAEG